MRGAGWQIAPCYRKPLEQPLSQRPHLHVQREPVESPFRHGFNRLHDPLPHPHWGCVTIPADIPNCSSPGIGGNGMDKGESGFSLGPEIFVKIHRFSFPPAAAVTTHAAAEAEASAGLGAARLKHRFRRLRPRDRYQRRSFARKSRRQVRRRWRSAFLLRRPPWQV